MNSEDKIKVHAIAAPHAGEQSVIGPMARFLSPLRLAMIIAVSIFVVEEFIMYLISLLPPLSPRTRGLFDASVLTILVSPALYFFLYRPLTLHMSRRRQADEALQKAHDELEVQVAERTAALTATNKALQHDITERKRTEAERNLLLNVTVAVSEAEDLHSALRTVLRKVCDATRWSLGEVWLPRTDGSCLECSPAWYSCVEGLEKFRQASEGLTFPPGVGLPGRVWSSKRPAWIYDVTADTNFPRAPFAREAGLKAALGIPVLAGDEVLAVMDFFLLELREEDERFVSLVSAVAAQVGSMIQRKRAEEAIRQSELQFRLVWEQSADGMRLINEQGVVVRVNEAFCRMVGKRREEIEGKPFTVIYTEAQQEHILRRYQARFSSRTIGSLFERGFTLWNGKKVWLEAANSYFEVAGQAPLLLSILRDVTERRKAQESLQKLLNAVEQIDEVIFMTDSEGIITYVNPAFERVYGFTKEEALGKTPRILESGTTTTEQYEISWQDLLSGKRIQAELVNKSKDGRLISVDTSMNPISDGQGDITGFIAVQNDITERKRMEEERKTLQQQFFQAQKMESIGTLAGGIAHDFNNILGIILGHSSFIEPGDIDPTTLSTRMAAITKAVQRGANLVRQILTFARKTDAALEPVNVNTTIEELAKMLRETFPKTTEIALHLDKTVPLITMDHTQLHQALLNLCVNARDAMNDPSWTAPKGSTLSIKTEMIAGDTLRTQFADAEGSHYVCIGVSDTGMGMDEATKQRIFEPFFTTKELGRGTGLGLAVVYGVVKSHQGFVDVESQPGRGTTFRLYLPIPEYIIELPQTEEKKSAEIPGGTETLLLVEDEESLLDLMKILLENKGYRVLTAHDGMEAIQVYTQHKESIALVLTDIGLPKLGGQALVATLTGINPRLDIIVTSGFLAPHVRSEFEKAGAKEFVHKPYVPAEIFTKIREVIDRACTP